ncbi:MAG: peptidylprolyl isomerase [Methylibium sp.]|uniref:peptidylprolyl isomerase n=1 Tax=Methylibium sp. TaxID=2067992 RepID=UPI0017979693|nr:peptidylprolyl isomerase [Methylibium sp.]MBA2723976.1 peptidylprolyl isomerase [Methylibium sp.]MBA3588586.1 peptidylprolyl isomerase [Methylibium sp.]
MRVEHVDLSTPQRPPGVARINGVALHAPSEALSADELRQRACTELLRQAAQAAGFLDAADACGADGATSEAATAAIEALLERAVPLPEPSQEACRRYYAAHEPLYRTGEQVRVRHVLFAVTPGVDVVALRKRAEMAMLEVRCFDGSAAPSFDAVAAKLSNCPSGASGGDLGWLTSADCAPEFARELFASKEVGVLPRLVHSRFGLHVVEVLEREAGTQQPFESVRGAVETALRQQVFVAAMRQFLQVLAGQAQVEGVDLDAAQTPLVQ